MNDDNRKHQSVEPPLFRGRGLNPKISP